MMEVAVLCVGRLKERYLTEGCREYHKRLGAYCRPRVVEVPEHRLPDNPGQSEIRAGLAREGQSLLAKIPKGALRVALCVEGAPMASHQLAQLLKDCAVGGRSGAAFLIGGSWGLSEEVKSACEVRLSLSAMTFPHQLARLLLLEQLYRAFSINSNGKYHK